MSRRKIKVSLFTESAHRDYNLFGTVSLNRRFFGKQKKKRKKNNTKREREETDETDGSSPLWRFSEWIDSRANGGYSLNLSILSETNVAQIAFQMGLQIREKEREKSRLLC